MTPNRRASDPSNMSPLLAAGNAFGFPRTPTLFIEYRIYSSMRCAHHTVPTYICVDTYAVRTRQWHAFKASRKTRRPMPKTSRFVHNVD